MKTIININLCGDDAITSLTEALKNYNCSDKVEINKKSGMLTVGGDVNINGLALDAWFTHTASGTNSISLETRFDF